MADKLTPDKLVEAVYKSMVRKHEMVGDDAAHDHAQIQPDDVDIQTGEQTDEQVAEEFETVEEVSAKTTEDYADNPTPPKSSGKTKQTSDAPEEAKPLPKPGPGAKPFEANDIQVPKPH